MANTCYLGYGSQTSRRLVVAASSVAGTVSVTCNGAMYSGATSGTYNACTIDITGLSPGTAYPFSVLFPSGETQLGELRTHPRNGQAFKIAWIGCVRTPVAADLFRKIADDPDITDVWLGGDTPYADYEAINNFGVNVAKTTTTPTEAVWFGQYEAFHRNRAVNYCGLRKGFLRGLGDHEFIDGWYDSAGNTTAAAWSPTALAVCKMFCAGNPQNVDAEAQSDDPIYFRHSIGPVELFVLDLIRYRVGLNTDADTGTPTSYTKTMLGFTQRDSLKARLSSSVAAFKMICSGWRTGTGNTNHSDGWWKRQNEELHIRAHIVDNAITTTFWASVDFHHPMVIHHPSTDVNGWHLDVQPCPGSQNTLHDPGTGYADGVVRKYKTGGGAATTDDVFEYGEVEIAEGWQTITVKCVGAGGVRWQAVLRAGINAIEYTRLAVG